MKIENLFGNISIILAIIVNIVGFTLVIVMGIVAIYDVLKTML